MSQHLKGPWGQRQRMSQLRDRWPISRGSPNSPYAPNMALIIPGPLNQIHEAEARSGRQCKWGTLRMLSINYLSEEEWIIGYKVTFHTHGVWCWASNLLHSCYCFRTNNILEPGKVSGKTSLKWRFLWFFHLKMLVPFPGLPPAASWFHGYIFLDACSRHTFHYHHQNTTL